MSFAIVNAVRVAGVGILPFPMGAGPLNTTWLAAFNLVVFAHATFVGLLLISMTKERHELKQRQIALVDPLASDFALIAAPETLNFAALIGILLGASVAVSAAGSGLSLRRFLRV